MGLMAAVGGTVLWHAENDPAPAKVLAARYPGVPNLGDLTAIRWEDVPRVDWLTAGFPCQPASAAGKRKGMEDDRWLWDEVARAVAGVRPRRVLLENVPGLLTVDGGRAFERVICDLAALGYVGRYRLVRASDVGAPHKRERVFILATDARRAAFGEQPVTESGRGGALVAGLHRPAAADTDGERQHRPAVAGPQRRTGPANGRLTPADADLARLEGPEPAAGHDLPAWGDYEPAVRRWEVILGRPAPAPTDARGRLSPPFVEWLMGLPAGWVTDVPDLSRSKQLHILGNGVVHQQATAAVNWLLSMEKVVA